MEATEVRKLARLEDVHWWYAERRHLLAAQLRGLRPGVALDVGAAGGGNTRVLRALGWQAIALEYGADGARIAAERGLATVRADATRLPIGSGRLDAVVAFDVLEHIPDDERAVAEIVRALRPGGTALIAVPCDPRLWSAHDVAVNHVRRYTRDGLVGLLTRAGLDVVSIRSWNVLLRPIVKWRRRASAGSDLDEVNRVVNAGLRTIIASERFLPVRNLSGVSLVARGRRAG